MDHKIKPQYIIFAILILAILYNVTYLLKPLTLNNHLKPPGQVTLSIYNSKKYRTEVLDHSNTPTKVTSNPINYASGTPIDLNGNGQIAMFINGSKGNDDMLLIYKNGKLIDIIEQTNLSSKYATYASVSADIDHNGLTDLVVARENGVFVYLNKGHGNFEIRRLTEESPNSVPVSLAITDYNKDGNADIYVSQHLHPRLQNRDLLKRKSVQNILLEGKGTGMFQDVTKRVRLAEDNDNSGHTVSSLWVDLDNDKLPDLILAQDTGDIVIYKGTRGGSGGKFVNGPELIKKATIKIPTGLGYQTIIKAGDIDGDGKQDIYLSNIGTKINPHADKDLYGLLAYKGNKRSQDKIILRNDGNFKFTNITEEVMKKDIDLGWNAIMENQDLKGQQKLLNIIDNSNYNDIDKNNLFWLNVAGPKIINLTEPNNNWIAVRVPDDAEFFNCNIKVVSINDQTGQIHTQNKQRIVSSNSSANGNIVKFDLGLDNRIVNLEVSTIYDGNRWVHPDPKINMIATFRYMQSNNYTAK